MNLQFVAMKIHKSQKSDKKIGLFITGMKQSTGYEYTKIIIEDKSTLLQITYAEDFIDIKTQ